MNNKAASITTEDIMAYVDGELPLEKVGFVSDAIAADSELQKEMNDYLASSAAVRHAYDSVLEERVPEHLRELVIGGDNIQSINRFSAPRPIWQQALAASVLFAVGLVIGSVWRGDAALGPSAMTAGALASSHPLSGILDTAASGQRLALAAEQVHMVQTFVTGYDDRVCREYEVTSANRGVTSIACRANDAWRIEVMVDGAAGVTDAQYLPASGANQAALDETYRILGAGDSVDANTERCLSENGWNISGCLGDSDKR